MKKLILLLTAFHVLVVFFSCKKEPNTPVIENKIVFGSSTSGTISYTTASVATAVVSITGKNAIQHGHCWGIATSPIIGGSKTSLGSLAEAKTITSQLDNLLPNTTYYIRAYATTELATTYGVETTIKTIDYVKPTISTVAVSGITHNLAISGGNVTDEGGQAVTARGLVWNTASEPSITSNAGITSGSIGLGTFSSQLTNLQPETTYFVRAYATNSKATSYGNELSFKTKAAPALASLTTSSPADVIGTSATLGGNVTSEGNLSVTERGICYSTNQNPTTSNSKIAIGAGVGSFSSSITGLTVNTTYYVRAYAINSQGTAYGNEFNFKTIPVISLATSAPTSITYNSAILGGNITSEGNSAITERGICYSKSQNPTTSDIKLVKGSGIGIFTSPVTDLITNTTYYFRSYAIDSQGTTYGNELNFTTKIVSIGDSYQGGIVAYLLKSGDSGYISGQTHGLIAAPSDQGKAKWYDGSYVPIVATGASGLAIGTGNTNTIAIVTYQGAGNYAAQACFDLVLNGYSDWYLPSRDELNALYDNRILIGNFGNTTQTDTYWSSSESIDHKDWAWQQMFLNGIKSTVIKQSSYSYRAVRSF